jgi:hypothetical protein
VVAAFAIGLGGLGGFGCSSGPKAASSAPPTDCISASAITGDLTPVWSFALGQGDANVLHVTQAMTEHDSHVGREEKLAAAGNVVRLVFGAGGRGKTGSGGDQVGDRRDPSDPSDQRPARNPAQLQ